MTDKERIKALEAEVIRLQWSIRQIQGIAKAAASGKATT